MRRNCPTLAVLIILATLGGQTPATGQDHIGWYIYWSNEVMIPSMLRQRTEESLALLMSEVSDDQVFWTHVSTGREKALAIMMGGGAPPESIQYDMPSDCCQLIIVNVEFRDGQWCAAARIFAQWLTTPSSGVVQCLDNPRLLALTIAQLLRSAWVPIMKVQALSGQRVRFQIMGSATLSTDVRRAKWPRGSIWSMVTDDGLTKVSGYRQLQYTYAKLDGGISSDGTTDASLLSIASKKRQLDALMEEGRSVFLVPASPAPGPIRIRPIDGSTREPLANVEVYASTRGHDRTELKGVTTPTGDPIEFADEQGGFWYVSLVSGKAAHQLWILNDGRGEVLELPMAAGNDSIVLDELQMLDERFNRERGAYVRLLEHADQLATQRRFTEAHQQYNTARTRIPHAEYACRQARRALKEYGRSDNRAADRERDAIRAQCQEFHDIALACSAKLDQRLATLLQTEDLASRRGRAVKLVKRAGRLRDNQEIDEALRLYDEAIQVLPKDDQHRTILIEQRERLARSWRIRGGEQQERARSFVFTRLRAMGPERAIRDYAEIHGSIVCLINNGDQHTLRRAVILLGQLADRLVAHFREAEENTKLKNAQAAREVIERLYTLLRRVNDALQTG